ncbi:MAG: threonine synthase [Eubacteriales bacterium]|jgi:threonine synthase
MSRFYIDEIKYVSTRDIEKKELISSAEAIRRGLAPDGGLYMPVSLPHFGIAELSMLSKLNYPERAAFVLRRYLTDYGEDELLSMAKAAYSADKFGPADKKGGANPIPLRRLSSRNTVMELWHGPTSAFKDMALQLMPRLLSAALEKTGAEGGACILVATSGDTGKAALEGYKNVDRTKIMVFYPAEGVSAVQKLQMITQEGENVCVAGVDGNFDDAQTGVKRIFRDPAVTKALEEKGLFFSSANSINWGRLAPQIVYYFSAYCDMASENIIKLGDEIDITVPTGNFGNIFAAYIAAESGLPIRKLICASNTNKVLTDFINDGVYDRRREFYTTISPSMDILISSNLERLLYSMSGPAETAEYMKALSEEGVYKISPKLHKAVQRRFAGHFADEDACRAAIKETYEKKHYLCDPHTAVAFACLEQYRRENPGETRKMLVVSTASPYKFAGSVLEAITGDMAKDELTAAAELSALTGTKPPKQLVGLESREVRFPGVISPDDMADEVIKFAGR